MAAERSTRRTAAEQYAPEPLAAELYAHVHTLSQQAQTTMCNLRSDVQGLAAKHEELAAKLTELAAKQEELSAAMQRLTLHPGSQQSSQPSVQQEQQQGVLQVARDASQQNAPPWLPPKLHGWWLKHWLLEEQDQPPSRQAQATSVPAYTPPWMQTTDELLKQLEQMADTPNLSPSSSVADRQAGAANLEAEPTEIPVGEVQAQMAVNLRQADRSVRFEPTSAESPEPEKPPGFERAFVPPPPPPPPRPRGSGLAGRGSGAAGRGPRGHSSSQTGRGHGALSSGTGQGGRHARGSRGKGGRGHPQAMASTSAIAERWSPKLNRRERAALMEQGLCWCCKESTEHTWPNCPKNPDNQH